MRNPSETPAKRVASDQEIHRVVRERYAAIARSNDTGCCEDVLGLIERASTSVSDCCGPDCCQETGADSTAVAVAPAAKALETVLAQVEAAGCCDDDCCSPAASKAGVQRADGASVAESGEEADSTLPNILGLGCGDPLADVDIRPGDRVVDLGSGAGGDAIRAARLAGPRGEVVGVDMTKEMLERARANAERSGVEGVRFVEGYIEALPLESGSADWILSNCVINLAPDKTPVFAEIARVLAPGGRMSVADIVRPAGAETRLPAPGERWASCIDGAMAVDAYREGLEAAGLVDVHIEAIGAVHAALEASNASLPFSAHIRARKPDSSR